jgi:hypothetical protein
MPVVGYDGIVFQVGDRIELYASAELWKKGSQYGGVVGIVSSSQAARDGVGENCVRVVMDGVEGVHSGPPEAFRLVYE